MVLTCFLKDDRWGLAWPHKTSGYKVSGLSLRMPYFRSLPPPLQLCRAMHPWQDYTVGREVEPEAVVGYSLQLDLGPDAAGSHFNSWIEIMLLSLLVLVRRHCVLCQLQLLNGLQGQTTFCSVIEIIQWHKLLSPAPANSGIDWHAWWNWTKTFLDVTPTRYCSESASLGEPQNCRPTFQGKYNPTWSNIQNRRTSASIVTLSC